VHNDAFRLLFNRPVSLQLSLPTREREFLIGRIIIVFARLPMEFSAVLKLSAHLSKPILSNFSVYNVSVYVLSVPYAHNHSHAPLEVKH